MCDYYIPAHIEKIETSPGEFEDFEHEEDCAR
jgi:hypothetical protein